MSPVARTATLCGVAVTLAVADVALAQDQTMGEVIVTARLQTETLQDVPVTMTALTREDLERYNINSLVDAGKMVPNMVISHASAGNGATLRLRGIGSSSISAAFDHSVAINLDGIVVNRGRFIHNSYLDLGQIEVLKGPQSLYFGKSATAGVVSVTTNDPGDEFEFELGGGIEAEHNGVFYDAVISGPLTDTFGARLAIGVTGNDELWQNYSATNDPTFNPTNTVPGWEAPAKWYGDESLNARLTLAWDLSDNMRATLKYSYSEYDNDGGGTAWTEEICPSGSHQHTFILTDPPQELGQARLGVDDCKLNGNTSKLNLHPTLRGGLPRGFDDGKPGLEQETELLSARIDYDPTDALGFTSITGLVELNHWELDDYSYGAGLYGGLHSNVYESLSQEFRAASNFDDIFNFQAGVLYQDVSQELRAYQNAANLSWLQGPDPRTGNAYDYNKNQFLDTEVLTAFFAMYIDFGDVTEITAGLRYTEENKNGWIRIPYVHAAAEGSFSAPSHIDGLTFNDTNVSPEIAISHHLNDQMGVYIAYKEGFKSGGIDNSALPSATLDPANNGGDFSFLEYESEEAQGIEAGFKGSFLNSAMRLNATVFSYQYTDLQVQLFNSNEIQFHTLNASGLDTSGVEFDMLWNTNIRGLEIRTAWAWTDTVNDGTFINAQGQDLDGQAATGSAELSGFIGFSLDRSVTEGWYYSLSADARYTGDYATSTTLDPYEQSAFWLLDASISIYTSDNRHTFSLIGRNISDEIYAISAGSIPGRCADILSVSSNYKCRDGDVANKLDQTATTPLGRTLVLRYRFAL